MLCIQSGSEMIEVSLVLNSRHDARLTGPVGCTRADDDREANVLVVVVWMDAQYRVVDLNP